MEKQNHTLSGCIIQDGKVFVPLTEMISLCFRFPTITGKQLMLLLEDANNRYKKTIVRKSPSVKKSFWRKFFGK